MIIIDKAQLILLLLLLTAFCGQTKSLECTTEAILITPQKFGIQTMTYSRSMLENSMQTFQNYLNHYANLNCDCFDNIYIIWNNQESPEQKGVKISNSWIKKVIFTKTPYNSLGWKYVIPQSAPEKVFFTVDDDLYLNCAQLKKGFQNWKIHSIGQLGPLVSYYKRTMTFQRKFKYQFSNMQDYYTISLMNCAFFSRQFTDLYYSDYKQIQQIRKIVQKQQNCEDIAMNFIVSYFYPELLPRIEDNIFQGQMTLGVSNTPDHYKKRNDCMNLFTQILSYNPLRYVRLKSVQIQRLNLSCIILKKQQYYKKAISHKTPQQIFQQDKIFNPKLNQQTTYLFQTIMEDIEDTIYDYIIGAQIKKIVFFALIFMFLVIQCLIIYNQKKLIKANNQKSKKPKKNILQFKQKINQNSDDQEQLEYNSNH